MGVVQDFPPLGEKAVLDKALEGNLAAVPLPHGGQGLGVPPLERFLPVLPARAAVGVFQRHEEGVVVQPGIFADKGLKVRCVFNAAGRKRLLQQNKTAVVKRAVIHAARVAPPIYTFTVRAAEPAFFNQSLEADKVWVAGVDREGLIRGIAVTGGAEGQHLPDPLARPGQLVDKAAGFLIETADSIVGGKGTDGQ